MVQIAGKYQIEKNDKYLEYLLALGMAEDIAKKGNEVKTVLDISVDGTKYTLKMNIGVISTLEFELNKEFDDPLPTGDVLKSTASVEGNKLIIKSKAADGRSGERIYNFSDKGMVMTLTSSVTQVVATRNFNRI